MKFTLTLCLCLLATPFSYAGLAKARPSNKAFYLKGFIAQTDSKTLSFQTKHKHYLLKKKSAFKANPGILQRKENQNRFIRIKIKPSYIISSEIKTANWSK